MYATDLLAKNPKVFQVQPNIDDANRKVKAWIPLLMPSSAPTGAGFIAKERAIQEDFVANFRDKHLAQIEWLGNRRRT